METKLKKYYTYKSIVNRLLLISGIWPHIEQTFPFYRIVAYSVIFVFGVCAAKIFGYCIDHIQNVQLFATGMSNAFSFTTSLLKVICFLKYRKELEMLNNTVGKKYEEYLKKIEYRPYLLDRISIYTRFMYIVATLTAAALIFYVIIPFIYIFKYKKLIQIYLGRYPFPVPPGSPIYWTIISIEVLSTIVTWNVVSSVDNAFGLHSFRFCGLLRLISYRIQKLKPLDPNYENELRDCVETHQMLIQAKVALQKVYGFIVLWTYVTSAFIMCSIMYQADQAKKNMTVTKMIFFGSYIALKLLQSFTYAYYGSLVSQESENFQDAVYMSNWAGTGNLKFSKDLLFIRTQRAMVLKASGFFIVSMEMFEKIVNTTMSYFFLLLTVEEKKS